MKLGLQLFGTLGLVTLTTVTGVNPAAAQASDVSRRIKEASGFLVYGAQAETLSKLPVPPARSTQDASGTCEKTELRFSDQAARDHWLLPGYNSMLNLWAILHSGARAGTSVGTRCADLEFSARRWQEALGEPVTGALTKGQVEQFTCIVDAHAPGYAQERARRSGVEVAYGSKCAPAAVVASTLAERSRPRDLRPGTVGLNQHVSGCFQKHAVQGGSKAAVLNCLLGPVPEPLERARVPPPTIRVDLSALELGDPFDVAMTRLAGPLCRATNQEITCSAQPTLTKMCAKEDRALVDFRRTVLQKIDWAIRYRETLNQFHDDVLAYPRLEDGLAACKERYRSAPETSAELLFDGAVVSAAQLTFSQRRLLEMRFHATDAESVSRWMTSRFGAPTVNLSTVGDVSVRRVPITQLSDQVFVENNQRTVRHQTWTAPGIAVQSEGAEFRITAVGQR